MGLGDIFDRMFGNSRTREREETDIDKRSEEQASEQTQSAEAELKEAQQQDTRLFNPNSKSLVKDKASLNLVVAVEQAVMAKQVSDQNVDELRSRLDDSKKQTDSLRRDLRCGACCREE